VTSTTLQQNNISDNPAPKNKTNNLHFRELFIKEISSLFASLRFDPDILEIVYNWTFIWSFKFEQRKILVGRLTADFSNIIILWMPFLICQLTQDGFLGTFSWLFRGSKISFFVPDLLIDGVFLLRIYGNKINTKSLHTQKHRQLTFSFK